MYHPKRSDKCAAFACTLFFSAAIVGVAVDAFALPTHPNSRPDEELDSSLDQIVPAPLKSEVRELITPHRHPPKPTPKIAAPKPVVEVRAAERKRWPKPPAGKHRRTRLDAPQGDPKPVVRDDSGDTPPKAARGILDGLLPGRICPHEVEPTSFGRKALPTPRLRLPGVVRRAVATLSETG